MDNPILSICIPTFNRMDKLECSLNAAIEASKNFTDYVEIIVSNNNSTDDTLLLLDNYSKKYNFLRSYSNIENIGPSRNFFKLIDDYALGKYCWLIGDDDFVDIDSVGKIVKLLIDNEDLNFLQINFRMMTFEEYKESLNISHQSITTEEIEIIKFDSIFDKTCKIENILCGFISSSIFLLEPIKQFDKTIFSDDTWSNFKNTFPHNTMFASKFKDKPSCFLSQPLLTATIHKKEWDDKLPLIIFEFLPQLKFYFISLGYKKSDFKITTSLIIKSQIAILPHVLLKKPLFLLKNVFKQRLLFKRVAYYYFFKKAIRKILNVKKKFIAIMHTY